MVRKAVIVTSIIGSALIMLDTFNAAESLTLLLLVGVVPGTDHRIPAIDVMSATATAITVIVLRITVWPALKTEFIRRIEATNQVSPAKKRTVRRIV
jgi:hypothetical protein